MQNQNSDLKINQETNDLDITRYRLSVTQDLEAIRQRIETTLRIFLRDWFLNEDLGVDYYGVVFQKNPDIFLVEAIIRSQILSVPLVNEITSFNIEYSPSTRNLTVEFKVNTNLGETQGQLEL